MAVLQLRKIMQERNIGNKALAEASGIPIGTLNKIIYGETNNPSLDTLRALATALNCTLDELLEEKFTEPHYIDPESKKIAQEMYDRPELKTLFKTTRKVSPEDLKAVQALIDAMAKKND